ncbi:MAG: hypothetical protein IPN07_16715 [Dehalococcoidia bacterium]|nr:hypothetical protein [Dehalococcoidia bacterium]
MDHGAREHSAPDLLSGLAEMAVTSELLAGSEDLSDTLQRLAHRARE